LPESADVDVCDDRLEIICNSDVEASDVSSMLIPIWTCKLKGS
jgi:hypothetical protein